MALSTAEQSSKVITAYADLAPQPDIRPDLLLRFARQVANDFRAQSAAGYFFLSQIQQSVAG